MSKQSGKKKQVADILPGWIMRIREMPHVSGVSYPVFEWLFCTRIVPGGNLLAWLQGLLVFQDSRGSGERRFKIVEDALAAIELEYGWGEPPYIREVFQDIVDIHSQKKLPASSQEEFVKICDDLRKRWTGFIDGHRKDDPEYQRARQEVISRIGG